MNKLLNYMMAAAAVCSLAACDDSDDNGPEIIPPISNNTTMAYVISEGTQGYNIDGSLTTIDFDANTSVADAFKAANGRTLGDTPQCGIVYGDHIFLGVCGSNTIEVLDRKTLRSVKQISLAGRQAQQPRSMVAHNGSVYISMYNGYVCRMDTVQFEINHIIPVGPNPEVMARIGDYLYVPNSDGMNWEEGYGTTATRIDLTNFTVERNFEVGLNPYEFIAGDNNDLYLICRGNYSDVHNILYKVNPMTLKSDSITEATYASYYDGKIYAIDAPWGQKPNYRVYDTATRDITDMPESITVDSPTGIGVCPFNGTILITSNKLNGEYPAYDQPGYCALFTSDGQSRGTYATGVTPAHIFF